MSINLLLGILFVILILLIGGDRGVVSLISLLGNLLVFFAMIWSMTAGLNPYIATILGSAAVGCITLLYQNGRHRKTAAALGATAVVIVVLLLLVYLFSMRLHLEGLNEIELQSELPIYYSFVIRVNMHQVAICLILIGLLGAVMDTAVSISSSLYEIALLGDHSARHLYHSGIRIGKDIIATTINTLYFAYIGEALLLLLYLQTYRYSLVKMLNSKAFLQDFTSIIFSMIGCLLVIPVTSWICGILFDRTFDERQE